MSYWPQIDPIDDGNGNQRLDGMSISQRGLLRKRWIPEFALNELQLRAVLCTAVVRYCFGAHPPAAVQLDLEYLRDVANNKVLYHQARVDGLDRAVSDQLEAHLRAVDAAGGYLQLITACSWRAWRLHWPWKVIASDLGIKHSQVTQILARLKRIAYTLGFPTHAPKERRPSAATEEAVLELWRSGLTVTQIAERLGCDRQPKVIEVLKANGVYKRRNPRGYTRANVFPSHGSKARKASPEQIIALRRQGLNVKQITASCGASYETVVRALTRAGLYERKQRRKTNVLG